MRLTRMIVPLAALVLALSAPPVADARTGDHADRLLQAPTHRVDGIDAGEAMALSWIADFPFCERLGRHGKILLPAGSEDVPCTVDSNTTVLVWGLSNTCDNSDPLSPWYGADERAQRACAVATIEPIMEEIRFSIDGRPVVDLHQKRYAIFSPQHEVPLAAGPATFTFTAYGWMAWLKKLPPGRHTLLSESLFNDGSEPHVLVSNLNVVRGR
jgi:hypothetical protein